MPRKRPIDDADRARVALRLFRCEPYSTSLTPASCAKRHRASLLPNPAGNLALLAAECSSCSVGRQHAKGLDAQGVTYVERITRQPLALDPHEALDVPDEPHRRLTHEEHCRAWRAKNAKERAGRKVVHVETAAELVERVRPHLERHPYATVGFVRELLGRDGGEVPHYDRVRHAMRTLRGGVDARKLGLGGHRGKGKRRA